MAEEITVEEILEKKKVAEEERTQIGLDKKIEDYRRIIEAELNPDFKKFKSKFGRSCLDDPFLLSLVEFLVAEEAVAIFGTEPFIAVEGFEDSDVAGAKKMNNLLKYQFYEDVTQYTIICWLIGAQAYPASVLKIGWDFKDEGPKIELCPIETIYFSPNATGPLNKLIPWVIHESWVHIDELKAAKAEDGSPLYQNLDELEEVLSSRPLKKTAAGDEYPRFTAEERKGVVHVLDFWTNEKNAAVAEEKVFIIEPRANPNEHKRKPFIVMNDWPKLLSPYGVSTIEKCYDSYRELVTRKNQIIDNIAQGINSGWYINADAGVDEDAVVEWDRGRIVKGHGPMGEAISRLTPDLSGIGAGFSDLSYQKQNLQDGTHAYSYARGETPIRKETATGLSQLVAAASIVFRFKTMVKENIAIKELAAMVGALNQQYLPEKKIVRILGSEMEEARYESISREDIQGRFDYIAKGSAIDPEIGKPMKRAHMLQMLQILAPLMQTGSLPPMFLLEYVLLLMNQFDMPEATMLAKKYAKPALQQQEMQQMMQRLQMMMQMGGGRGGAPMQAPGMPGPGPGRGGPEEGTPQTLMKQQAGVSLTP